MSSSTSETDGKRPKQTSSSARTSHLYRDKPLFASLRPPPRLQQHSEFFTDSLNTSYIPSPSPPKNAARQSVGARPRQAFANGKSLAAAFKATANITDENMPPSSTSSSGWKLPPHVAKRRPIQNTPLTPPRPATTSSKEPERMRTPSPDRGRQAAVASPASSASSPPRGLAEAYQRIVDEENLAGQENEDMDEGEDDMTNYGYHYTHPDRSHDTDRVRLQQIRDSASPISLKASRRASPLGTIAEIALAEDMEREHEIDVPKTGSESGVSFLDNITDDSIGRALAQHARDEQKLNGLVKRDGQPFSRARVGERGGLTVENLRRKDSSNESSGSGTVGGSISSRGSEPSLNIPREWGRKGKGGKDWLSRINSRSRKFTGASPIDPKVAITTDPDGKESAGRVVDWVAAAADVPLPSVEEGASHAGLSSQSSTPMSMLHGKTSIGRVREWEVNDNDFTARSLQVSDSPPLRIRNATLDRIREREIESLEKRAVTTNRLGELRGKSSMETLGRRSPKIHVKEHQRQMSSDMEISSRQRTSSGELPLQPIFDDNHDPDDDDLEGPSESEEQGDPIPDTPVVIYKSFPKIANGNGDGTQTASEKDKRPSSRPSFNRDDSRDLLRSLARATSASPSPTKEHDPNGHSDAETSGNEIAKEQTRERAVHEAASQPGARATGMADSNGSAKLQRRFKGSKKTAETPQQTKSKVYLETPLVTGAWIDTAKTPQQKPTMNLKTPLVTGAWIDTPLPTSGRGLPGPTPEDLDAVKDLATGVDDQLPGKQDPHPIAPTTPSLKKQALGDTGPDRPKSALAAILEKAKRKPGRRKTTDAPTSEEDNTLALGDDTIQSLEDLVVKESSDMDVSALLKPEESAIDLDTDKNNGPLTVTQKARQIELLGYDRLTARLSKLGLSIRDAKKGIATLEQAVSNNTGDDQCTEAGEFHDFIWPCQKCGCPGRNNGALVRSSDARGWEISIPTPRLWRWDDGDWRPRLTWLGLVTLGAFLVMAEIIVWYVPYARGCPGWHLARKSTNDCACSDMYSPPFYATRMVSFGVDLDRPRPPFILAKLLWRSPIGYILKPLWFVFALMLKSFTKSLAWLVRFVYEFAFGERDGTGHGGISGNRMRQPVARDMRIPRPSWGPDLSMMDDDYI